MEQTRPGLALDSSVVIGPRLAAEEARAAADLATEHARLAKALAARKAIQDSVEALRQQAARQSN